MQHQIESPNDYILELSQLHRMVSRKIPGISPASINQEIDREIKKNYKKYKKETLTNERVKLTLEEQRLKDSANKDSLSQFIEEKIESSKRLREARRIQDIERKRMVRMSKEVLIKDRKNQLQKEKIAKSLHVIKKLDRNNPSSSPLKLRLLEEEILNQNKQLSARKRNQQQLYPIRSEANLYKIQELYPYSISTNPQTQNSNTLLLTEVDSERNGQSVSSGSSSSRIVQGLRQRRQTSQSRLDNASNRYTRESDYSGAHKESSDRKQELIEALLEEKRAEGYNKWVEKNSIASRAKGSHHREIKDAIEEYLKSQIVRQ